MVQREGMQRFTSFIHRIIPVTAALSLCACLLPVQAEEKAVFNKDKAEQAGLGMPTPYDKFLALEMALKNTKLDWGVVFRKVAVTIDPDTYTNPEIDIPLVLGIRIADGVMAIKAKDAELLNKAASDIELLAQKMGIKEEELTRARQVRDSANKGDWLKVFMELGFFQQDIMKRLEQKENKTKGTLLIAAGWIQGARYTSLVIQENYTPELSNILREPMLVKAIADQVKKLPESTLKDPKVAGLLEALGKLQATVDIKTDGSITKEKLDELNAISTSVVKSIIGNP